MEANNSYNDFLPMIMVNTNNIPRYCHPNLDWKC